MGWQPSHRWPSRRLTVASAFTLQCSMDPVPVPVGPRAPGTSTMTRTQLLDLLYSPRFRSRAAGASHFRVGRRRAVFAGRFGDEHVLPVARALAVVVVPPLQAEHVREVVVLDEVVGIRTSCGRPPFCASRTLASACKHSTHSDVTLPGCYLTLRVRSVFGIKNSPDVTDYVAASTECHTGGKPPTRRALPRTDRIQRW